MDWITAKAASLMGPLGLWLIVFVQVAQFVSSAERAALMDALKGLIDAFKNIPRRWSSEVTRVREQIDLLRRAGLDDHAAVKAASLPLKASVRVIAGLFEDIANRVIDLAVIAVPFAVTLVRAFMRKR